MQAPDIAANTGRVCWNRFVQPQGIYFEGNWAYLYFFSEKVELWTLSRDGKRFLMLETSAANPSITTAPVYEGDKDAERCSAGQLCFPKNRAFRREDVLKDSFFIDGEHKESVRRREFEENGRR